MKRVVVGITGASGSIYGLSLVRVLLEAGCWIDLIITEAGRLVLEDEVRKEDYQWMFQGPTNLHIYDNRELMSDIASGSALFDSLVIAPCSMDTVSAVASGRSSNLLERVADVALKEKRRCVLVPRETPLSIIHLRNLLTVAEAGAIVLPAMPAFYHKPQDIHDLVKFIVGKILNILGMPQGVLKPWQPARHSPRFHHNRPEPPE